MIADYASPTYEIEQRLRELLRHFTYRPGWTFEVHEGNLVVGATVIDADNPTRLIPLQFAIGLPSFTRPEFPLKRWLFDQVMTVERHEAQEFFQIDGEKPFDPHPRAAAPAQERSP